MKQVRSESNILLEKIKEQADIAERLISLIPNQALEWRPQISTPSSWPPDQRYQESDEASDFSKVTVPAHSELSKNSGFGNDSDLLSIGHLLGHLLDCLAGFCALLYSVNPPRLAHFGRLRGLEVNHFCGTQEAMHRVREYKSHIEEGFALLDDSDLSKPLPTVFVSEGEPILTLMLGNLEHLINHKYQLFMYLRLLGVPLGTRDLYRFRDGQPGSE